MPNHPLAEVFGFPIDNLTEDADRHRQNLLCPFGNAVPNCTKTSIENPLGVCSVFGANGETVITCPVRFQQGWRIASDAAAFFFPPGAAWTSLTEVRLKDSAGKSAGNIEVVLLSYDEIGRITDYGPLEVQAVYISGNVSSSPNHLAPQIIFKGGILNGWGRKMAVALNTGIYNALLPIEEVDQSEADIAFLLYDLVLSPMQNRYVLTLQRTVYTKYDLNWGNIMKAEMKNEFTGAKSKQRGRMVQV